MGRQSLAGPAPCAGVTKRRGSLDIATSADLLFSLPGQTPAQMDRDLDIALSLRPAPDLSLQPRAVCRPQHARGQGCRAGPRHAEQRHRLRKLAALTPASCCRGYRQTTLKPSAPISPPARRAFATSSPAFPSSAPTALGIGPLGLVDVCELPGQRRGISSAAVISSAPPWSRDGSCSATTSRRCRSCS